jgi:glycolate oxidase
MALERSIYRVLEDIVGPENISEEPAVLDSYAFQWPGELIPTGKGDRFIVRPEAVVLPGGTEEVQAIVKTCNRYKIKFKAFSTGWGAHCAPKSDGVIQLDLRRMNRILEIDERNMYAVVEPYVITARFQAELMRRGFNCNTITAGSNVSALPLSASGGDGYSSVSTSMNPRNLLGVEWVLPTGEILRLGSLGSGSGWFCGDGPGPSLRGVIRGLSSTVGGMGVFTKAATKIYHWPGPPVPPAAIEGVSPSYRMKPSPEMYCYCLVFPSWKELIIAGIKIAESEIAYILQRIPTAELVWTLATSNKEGAELFSKTVEALKGRYGFLIVILSANSRREFDYQQKVIREILVETKGECLPLLEERNIREQLIWRLTRVTAGSMQAFRPSGGSSMRGTTMVPWNCLLNIEGLVNLRHKDIGEGLILNEGPELSPMSLFEYGHMDLLGVLGGDRFYDPADRESIHSVLQAATEGSRIALEKYKCNGLIARGEALHEAYGRNQSNYHVWLRKIKKAFDPNVASDPSSYITPEK